MDIAVIGSGYVGLVASACFATMDHRVTCVDCDAAKIESLRAGVLPIYEPGLEPMVVAAMRSGRLAFSTDLAAAVGGAKVAFIAVGTPDRDEDGKPDLSNVFMVARQIASALRQYCVVVTKSTVPVGTSDAIENILARNCSRALFDVASNPEFLREGCAIQDFNRPDRIVVGTDSNRARAVMARLYTEQHFGTAPVLFTSRRTSELVKYASNAFLASKVAFINEVADLCENVGGDIEDVARGMGLDERIGPEFLRPGPGYGGSCLPKDTRALARMAKEAGGCPRLCEAIVAANDARKRGLAARVVAACGGSIAGREIALLGVTFKSNTDDVRDSPALPLIAGLQELGARVRAYDPAGSANMARMVEGVSFVDDADACVKGAHAVVVVTDWPEFRRLDLARLRKLTAEPVVVDLRNIYDGASMAEHGIAYHSIGRDAVAGMTVARTERRLLRTDEGRLDQVPAPSLLPSSEEIQLIRPTGAPVS